MKDCSVSRLGLLALVLLLAPSSAVAQRAWLDGEIVDSTSQLPVIDATVFAIRDGRTVGVQRTDARGRFSFSSLEPGVYRLRVAAAGYRPLRGATVDLTRGRGPLVRLLMERVPFLLDEIVVTATPMAEAIVDVPASVSLIAGREARARTTLSLGDHLSAQRGIDVAATGLMQRAIVARGFNGAASGRLLTLVDFRYASVPALRINAYNFIPTIDDDIDRIEVVRGPAAALYGPNNADGVFHTVTSSPLESPGTALTVTGGERALFHTTFRSAGRLAETVGAKVSLQYLRADDWPFVDSTEARLRQNALDAGADATTLRIGRRDPRIERFSGDVRVDIEPTLVTRFTLSAGTNEAINNLDITPLGGVQVNGWSQRYLQSRLRHRGFLANVFLNTTHSGNTYLLRDGRPIVDDSRHLVGQLQQTLLHGGLADVVVRADAQRTIPRTSGTVMGRNEADDHIDEVGGYVNVTLHPSAGLEVIGALRVDYHNRLEGLVWSPRGAVVIRPAVGQSVRFTYNRGYDTPSADNLFLDLALAPAEGFPFGLRAVGVPTTGYTFRRDCPGGLCMRSPHTDPGAFLPLDATLFWGVVVQVLLDNGIDIRGIPAPTSDDVATTLAVLDLSTITFRPVAAIADIPQLQPTITHTVELGYKGLLSSWASFELDVYRTWKKNFVSPLRVETPNVFVEQTTLSEYLEQFMPAADARGIAEAAAMIPVGIVTPQEARDPTDILITVRNIGDIALWGVDASATVLLTGTFSIAGAYSWASDDTFPVESGFPTLTLNAPRHKGSFSTIYEDARIRGELRVRAVSDFHVRSGVYDEGVDGYGLLDASLSWRLPVRRGLTVSITAQNVLDHRHREFAGVPAIGRLILGRVRAEF